MHHVTSEQNNLVPRCPPRSGNVDVFMPFQHRHSPRLVLPIPRGLITDGVEAIPTLMRQGPRSGRDRFHPVTLPSLWVSNHQTGTLAMRDASAFARTPVGSFVRLKV